MIAVPQGAEVVKISPSRVTIKLERTAEASLEVHATVRGKPAAGFRVARIEIEPTKVVVRAGKPDQGQRRRGDGAGRRRGPVPTRPSSTPTSFSPAGAPVRLASDESPGRGHDRRDKAAPVPAGQEKKRPNIMKKKLFGTDGVRAVAGHYPLDPPTISRLGQALVGLLESKGLGTRLLIGRDTRESGPWMERALARGVRVAGGEAVSRRDHPDFGRFLPDEDAWLLGRRGNLRLPQSLPRQRDQDLLAARHQDPRRMGARDRSGRARRPRAGCPAAKKTSRSTAPWQATMSITSPAASGRRPGRRRAQSGRRCANGASSVLAPRILSGARLRGRDDQRLARRPKHQRRLRLAASRGSLAARVRRDGRGHRHRL